MIATVRPPRGDVKRRPAVVVTPTDQLVPGATVRLAGVSASYRPDDPAIVVLPGRPDRNVPTRLTKDSAASAAMADDAVLEDLVPTGGYISKGQLAKLLALMGRLGTL